MPKGDGGWAEHIWGSRDLGWRRKMGRISTWVDLKSRRCLDGEEDRGRSPHCTLALRSWEEGFPGGTAVKNPPANAGDTGSSPGLGRSHMPRSS